MSATTIGTVFDRVNSLVASQGFEQCRDPFDFDMEPAGHLDSVFRVESSRSETFGYLGGDQEEVHKFDIWLARKIRRNPHGAVRQLKSDMDLIEAQLYGEYQLYDYQVVDDSVEGECRVPFPDAEFVVARLSAAVSFDRDL